MLIIEGVVITSDIKKFVFTKKALFYANNNSEWYSPFNYKKKPSFRLPAALTRGFKYCEWLLKNYRLAASQFSMQGDKQAETGKD